MYVARYMSEVDEAGGETGTVAMTIRFEIMYV